MWLWIIEPDGLLSAFTVNMIWLKTEISMAEKNQIVFSTCASIFYRVTGPEKMVTRIFLCEYA